MLRLITAACLIASATALSCWGGPLGTSGAAAACGTGVTKCVELNRKPSYKVGDTSTTTRTMPGTTAAVLTLCDQTPFMCDGKLVANDGTCEGLITADTGVGAATLEATAKTACEANALCLFKASTTNAFCKATIVQAGRQDGLNNEPSTVYHLATSDTMANSAALGGCCHLSAKATVGSFDNAARDTPIANNVRNLGGMDLMCKAAAQTAAPNATAFERPCSARAKSTECTYSASSKVETGLLAAAAALLAVVV